MLESLGQFFSTGSSHSPYLDLLVGVPQGSILDPFLFSKYMWDLFLCDCESKMTVDNATPYYCGPNMDLVLSKKETSFQFLHGFRTTIWKLISENHIF